MKLKKLLTPVTGRPAGTDKCWNRIGKVCGGAETHVTTTVEKAFPNNATASPFGHPRPGPLAAGRRMAKYRSTSAAPPAFAAVTLT